MHLTRLATIHRLGPDQSLLLNALSGAVDIVNDSTRTQLLQLGVGREPDFDEGTRELLVARHYLFADEAEERATLEHVYQGCQKAGASRPLQFVICPTYGCNLACSYCFESPRLRSEGAVMTPEQVDSCFAAAAELATAHPGRQYQIGLFGGEPLLPATEAVVEAIVQRAGEAGYSLQVVTNGTHLERFVPLLARFPELARGVQVTLDGPQPVHDVRRKYPGGDGSFEQIVRGVDAALAAGLEVNLRVNIDAHNLDSLEPLAEFITGKGWLAGGRLRCQIAPVTDHLGTSTYPFLMREDELVEPVLSLWRQRPQIREVLDFRLFRVLAHLIAVIEQGGSPRVMPRFHYCEADRGDVYTFGPDGLIYLCPESIGRRRYAVGSYAPKHKLWMGRLSHWRNRSIFTLSDCRQCSIATFCGGGCGFSALKRHGTPMRSACAGAPEIVKAYVRTLRGRSPLDEPHVAEESFAGPRLC